MNTSYAMNSYRAHDLNIAMRTSSGDAIKMNFANHQTGSFSHEQNENSSRTSMSFSSMQSFKFSMDTNGIDAQDQKEIDTFMKIAQPFIDSFLEELQRDAPKTPVTKLAHGIASIFQPERQRDNNAINNIKTNIVKMFDNAMKKYDKPEETNIINSLEKMINEAQKLLEKTLKEFEEFNKNLYV